MRLRTKIALLCILLSLVVLLYIDVTTEVLSERWRALFSQVQNSKEKTQAVWQRPTSAPVVVLDTTSSLYIPLPMEGFQQHHVILFIYPTATKSIRFYVIQEKQADTIEYRAVADACLFCYEKQQGFEYKDMNFICRDCSMEYHSSRVGIASGGCNPIIVPIEYTEGKLKISKDDLAKIAQIF